MHLGVEPVCDLPKFPLWPAVLEIENVMKQNASQKYWSIQKTI